MIRSLIAVLFLAAVLMGCQAKKAEQAVDSLKVDSVNVTTTVDTTAVDTLAVDSTKVQ